MSGGAPEPGYDTDRATEPSAGRDVEQTVEQRARRKIVAERSPHRTVWFGLGMFGLVGWAVAIPTLLGLALGLWLDRVTESERSWSLACLIAGVGVGGLHAYYWVRRELPR